MWRETSYVDWWAIRQGGGGGKKMQLGGKGGPTCRGLAEIHEKLDKERRIQEKGLTTDVIIKKGKPPFKILNKLEKVHLSLELRGGQNCGPTGKFRDVSFFEGPGKGLQGDYNAGKRAMVGPNRGWVLSRAQGERKLM